MHELLEDDIPVKISPAIDEHSGSRIELPDEISPPIVVIKDGVVRGMSGEESDSSNREALCFRVSLLAKHY